MHAVVLFAVVCLNSMKISFQFNQMRSRLVNRAFSSKNNNFYVTTPIFYVNGNPHLGHAYSLVIADAIARFKRLKNYEVLFLTGTDEHGLKVQKSASANNTSPLEYATIQSQKFRELCKILDCTNDDFIRTTETRHKMCVIEVWKTLVKNGYIYHGEYEGWYSVTDEAFYSSEDLVDGKAPSGSAVEWIKEPSYFFKLSAFGARLKHLYDHNPSFVIPEAKMNFVRSFVGDGSKLKDISISRTSFSWGIPVPTDTSDDSNDSDSHRPPHVIYVWLDALVNYISALDMPLATASAKSKFWPADVHVVGKDILIFHSVFWPAFLMALHLPPPRQVLAHGWWTSGGAKMSKSLGNVVDPLQYRDRIGTDSLRYFLLAEGGALGNDVNFTESLLASKVNANLANDFGNFAQRSLSMIAKNFHGSLGDVSQICVDAKAAELLGAAQQALLTCEESVSCGNFPKYCDSVMHCVRLANKYFNDMQPWVLVGSGLLADRERAREVLYVAVEVIRRAAVLMQPITPAASRLLLDQAGVPEDMRSFDSLCSRVMHLEPILSPKPVFPRIDMEVSQVINKKK